jgi:hypothetical protein
MEIYEFKNKQANYDFSNLESLVEEGRRLGLDIKELADKITSIKRELNDDLVRIVLLGSFSDGKTSAVAGLLGRLDSSMKIDIDESSDDLAFYRPEGLKKGFEIVDTPGLFGTKDKPIDGKDVKFSSITENYISQAHIVLYVCEAVNPIKASHLPIIKRVIRDYGKLENTVFIINKMDSVCDTTDDEDFSNMERIKKENLISRLRSEIQLTAQEEARLNVVCISADPKGKGLEHWFANSDNYMKRSHIGTLRKTLDKVVENVNKSDVQKNAVEVSVKDVVYRLGKTLAIHIKPIEENLDFCSNEQEKLNHQFKLTSENISDNRNALIDKLNSYKTELLKHINASETNTIRDVVEQEIGIEDKNVTFNVVIAKVQAYIRECAESNYKSLNSMGESIEASFDKQNKFFKEILGEGAKWAGKITGDAILNFRNFFNIPFKFKPWGAQNLAKLIGKIGAGIQIALVLWEIIAKLLSAKKLNETKDALKKAINSYFADLFKAINDNDSYYKDFAPSYLEMKKILAEKDKEIATLKDELQKIKKYKNNLSKFYGRDITDVEWEEV